MKKGEKLSFIITGIFLVFAIVSAVLKFDMGVTLLKSYWEYVKFILAIMPGVFLLIGLFKVWVKDETVIKHMGEKSGFKGFLLAIVLAFTCIGGLFAALPIAKQLYDKGSKLSVILTYLGASCICRVPMTLWEASMLGVDFTILRYVVSIPLIIVSSILLEKVIKTVKIKEIQK